MLRENEVEKEGDEEENGKVGLITRRPFLSLQA